MAKRLTSREGAIRDSRGRVSDDAFHADMLGDDTKVPAKTVTPMDAETRALLYGKPSKGGQ